MRSLTAEIDGELIWTQPSARHRRYELRAGDETVATLDWQKSAGSLALATTADGAWTLKRDGFWHPRVTARPAGTETEVARFEAGWTGGGTLRLEGGETFAWKPGGFWQTRWGWHDAAGSVLVGFRQRTSMLKTEGVVEIEAAAPAPLALLLCLGWYLVVLSGDDSAASAAGVAGGAAGGAVASAGS